MLTALDLANLDVSALKKGDYITPDSLEEHFGVSREATAYSLKVLALKEHIQDESTSAGRPLLARIEQYGISIMEDRDALEYKAGMHRRYCRLLKRTHGDLAKLDRANLDADEQRRLDAEEIRQSRVLQAILAANRALAAAVQTTEDNNNKPMRLTT